MYYNEEDLKSEMKNQTKSLSASLPLFLSITVTFDLPQKGILLRAFRHYIIDLMDWGPL